MTLEYLQTVSRTRLSRCVTSIALNSCLNEKEQIAVYMELACSTAFVCFNYSISFINDDFPASKSSTKEARLLRNDMLSLKSRCHN